MPIASSLRCSSSHDKSLLPNLPRYGLGVPGDACKVGLEGVVSKVRDSRYSSGRGNDWVKKTCAQAKSPASRSTAMTRTASMSAGARRGPNLSRQGQSWLQQDFNGGVAQEPDAADPKDQTLHQADRVQGDVGGTTAACREVCRRLCGTLIQWAARRYVIAAAPPATLANADGSLIASHTQ